MANGIIIDKRPFLGPTENVSGTGKRTFSGPISENLKYSDPKYDFSEETAARVGHATEHVSEMFPIETKIISCDFESEKSYTAELRLKCKTKEEFKIWLTGFQSISNTIFRVLYTVPCKGEKVLYKAVYRCQHNTYPSSHKVKTPSKKHTGCSAKLNVSVKAPVGPKSRTQDTMIDDYPTIIKLTNKHNHEMNVASSVKYKNTDKEVREKFIDPFGSQHRPSKALELHKRDLLEKYDDDYYKMQADHSVCPELPWTDRLQEMRLIMKDITETLEANFKDSEIEFVKALKSMQKNICNIKTKADLFSAIHNFGKIKYKAVACRKSTSIPVQPTAVQHRKFTVGAHRYLKTGRPAKSSFISEHDYAERKKNAIPILSGKKKATLCVQENIDRNVLSNN